MKGIEFLKGMGAGLMVGACVGLTVMPPRRKGKRQLKNAVRTMGQVIEDIGGAMRF